ncbi:pyroglutamyl-peptidase I [Ranunculus cassubicifolius]
MGSEGPSGVTVHVTGFKKFHGVADNPTETIVANLKGFLEKRGGLPKGLVLGSCSVLETAGQGALDPLYETLESAAVNNTLRDSSIIWLHFGVNSGATRFAIEHQAVNEATFRCPDELGWKPQTTLPVDKITRSLAKMGYDVMTSYDAGRFVCNYVYYHSLRFAEQQGIKSLFVHFPLFHTIDEDTQMQFAVSLLEVLASLN